jgi:two-component system sensor histidine kinase KdpD
MSKLQGAIVERLEPRSGALYWRDVSKMAKRAMRATLALAAVSLVTLILRHIVPVNLTTAGFAYLVTVLLIAARWGLAAAISASILATLCFNYFFLPPVGTLHIDDPDNWIALSSFLVTAMIASQLSEIARRNHELAARAEAARQQELFKSTLLDAVAHEFKTPLTSIKAATSAILTSDTLTPAHQRELLTIVDEETERLARLMREVFHLARAQAGKLHLSRALYDPEPLVRETMKRCLPGLKGRQVDMEFVSTLARVDVDLDLFTVAFKQLIDNAARYSPPESRIRVVVEASAEWVWFRVHNQGKGLTAEERQLVFERYYRSSETRERVAGEGIGLAIAQDIIQAHGGLIEVESAPNMGTEFSIRLPAAKGRQP